VLPSVQATTWFKTPEKDDEYLVGGGDDTSFCLDNLMGIKISSVIAECGHNTKMILVNTAIVLQ
jgi:hypothetical protein